MRRYVGRYDGRLFLILATPTPEHAQIGITRLELVMATACAWGTCNSIDLPSPPTPFVLADGIDLNCRNTFANLINTSTNDG
jgi:hypothetical protein